MIFFNVIPNNKIFIYNNLNVNAQLFKFSIHANVACEVVAVISLFKLEIWKTLGKPYPLKNYCKAIDDTRTVKNTGHITDTTAWQALSLTKQNLWKKSENIHIMSPKQNKKKNI